MGTVLLNRNGANWWVGNNCNEQGGLPLHWARGMTWLVDPDFVRTCIRPNQNLEIWFGSDIRHLPKFSPFCLDYIRQGSFFRPKFVRMAIRPPDLYSGVLGSWYVVVWLRETRYVEDIRWTYSHRGLPCDVHSSSFGATNCDAYDGRYIVEEYADDLARLEKGPTIRKPGHWKSMSIKCDHPNYTLCL